MVVAFNVGLEVVVANAEVGREARRDFPLILKIGGAVPAHVVDVEEGGQLSRVHRAGDGAGGRPGRRVAVSQKVGGAEAGVAYPRGSGIKPAETVAAVRRDGSGGGYTNVLEINSEFDGVPARHLGDVVEDLEDVLILNGRIPARRAEPGDSADICGRQAAVVFTKGNAAKAQL